MKNSLLFILFSIFIINSCTSQKKENSISSDPSVNAIFTQHHTDDLELILNFFDTHVIEITETKKLQKAYEKFMFDVSNVASAHEHLKKIQLDQEKIEHLITKIKPSYCFNEIWYFEYGFDYVSKDTLSVYLNINNDGSYFQFLQILNEDNYYLKEYVDGLIDAGGISPSLQADFHEYANHFDLNDPKYRLICAIHYITVVYRKDFNS